MLIKLHRANFINCCQLYAVSVIRFIAFIFGKQVKTERERERFMGDKHSKVVAWTYQTEEITKVAA